MVKVSLRNHPLTASAALVWSGDLPRPLQQMLFQTADNLTTPPPPQPAELASPTAALTGLGPSRFFAELAPSYALEWLICASRIPLTPGGSRAPIRSERIDSSHANQISHAPWQITLDKLAWENRGPIAPSPPRSRGRGQ